MEKPRKRQVERMPALKQRIYKMLPTTDGVTALDIYNILVKQQDRPITTVRVGEALYQLLTDGLVRLNGGLWLRVKVREATPQ